jgi:hypothetical protein
MRAFRMKLNRYWCITAAFSNCVLLSRVVDAKSAAEINLFLHSAAANLHDCPFFSNA